LPERAAEPVRGDEHHADERPLQARGDLILDLLDGRLDRDVERQQALVQRQPHRLARLAQPAIALPLQLGRHLAEGDGGEDRDGEERAADEEHEGAPGDFAGERPRVELH
jgi:hypothetical protein